MLSRGQSGIFLFYFDLVQIQKDLFFQTLFRPILFLTITYTMYALYSLYILARYLMLFIYIYIFIPFIDYILAIIVKMRIYRDEHVENQHPQSVNYDLKWKFLFRINLPTWPSSWTLCAKTLKKINMKKEKSTRRRKTVFINF